MKWYKKAYEDAMLFGNPTVLPTMDGLKGFSDGNGSELVVGTNKLMNMIAELDQMEEDSVMDMIIKTGNDACTEEYCIVADQAAIDSF